jgi:hypothetical protein
VFTESEVVDLTARGASRPVVAAGIHQSIAKRAAAMLKRVSVVPPVALAGGVAGNGCLVKLPQETLGTEVTVPEEPRFAVALGALASRLRPRSRSGTQAHRAYALGESELGREGSESQKANRSRRDTTPWMARMTATKSGA